MTEFFLNLLFCKLYMKNKSINNNFTVVIGFAHISIVNVNNMVRSFHITFSNNAIIYIFIMYIIA